MRKPLGTARLAWLAIGCGCLLGLSIPACSQSAPQKESAPQVESFPETEADSSSPTALAAPEAESQSAPNLRIALAPDSHQAASPAAEGPLASPSGDAEPVPSTGFATVRVFYATDRATDPVPLGDYAVSGAKGPMMLMLVVGLGGLGIAFLSLFRGRSRVGALAGAASLAALGVSMAMLTLGTANIEKRGVTYTAERGLLNRGLAEVTVPDSHQRGQVERPSLLRFEFREDQSKHIVMTSAVELGKDDFYRRMRETVDGSPDRDLLVFIHGYNVDFDSAMRRTAQIAVDLPFRGVPVCYSWPSQGQLLGYTIDENNAAWTASHLKSFLLELAERSGADSINLVAHSMGNRALTSALSEISFEIGPDAPPIFDRVVMAAPDVDADQFRRDLASRMLRVSQSVTLYASSDDNALIVSKQVHGYPRAGESGHDLVVVPGIETVDVSGIDLSLLGHSYYGDSGVILRDLFQLVNEGLPAARRSLLEARELSGQMYWQLVSHALAGQTRTVQSGVSR